MKLEPIAGCVVALALLGSFGSSSALLAQAPASPSPPMKPAEYITIVQEIHIDRAPDVVWSKVGGYCDLGAWMKTTCVYTTGSGGVGTNRLIAGRINEVMVAKTTTSYTYAQPMAPNLYHGTVEILPEAGGSKIVYSLFYDVSALPDQAAKDADRGRRAKLFMSALQSMKTISESP